MQPTHPEMEIAFAGIAVPLFNLAFPKNKTELSRAEFER